MHIYDMLIIGGGPAGYTAALYAARAGLDTVVVEKMGAGGQVALTGTVDNYPGFDEGIDGFTLGTKMQAGAERFGAKTKYAEVTEVRLSETPKAVVTTAGTFLSRTVVVATGADPRKLGLAEEEALTGRGIHYCAHCDGRFYKGKTVAVVGGGNSAAADALYLSRLAEKVYLIHRRDTLRATRVYHEPLMNAANVEFLWDSTVTDCTAEKRLNGIKIKSTKTGEEHDLPVDGLFVSIGRSPNTGLFKGQLSLDANGYIIADESTKTNIDGVYAVGDVRTKELRQIVTAVADGAVAVHHAEEHISRTEKK